MKGKKYTTEDTIRILREADRDEGLSIDTEQEPFERMDEVGLGSCNFVEVPGGFSEFRLVFPKFGLNRVP
ncbi:MAG: hypothetical protein ACFUZC_16295 [Chthoniobacteraceae bacterium]